MATARQIAWQPDSSLEQNFLLALIGRNTPERIALCEKLLPEVNWEKLLDLAQPGLYPYMGHCLESRLAAIGRSCPEEVLLRLRGARQATALHNLRLLSELRNIVGLFKQQDVPILVLKGMVLAHRTYADASLRPMQDIDLLVPPEKRRLAEQLLRDVGYEYPERLIVSNRSLRTLLHPDSEIALGMQKRGTRVLVELHTQIEIGEPLFPVRVDEFWQRSVAVELRGLQVRTLGKYDFLFHLCLHLARNHVYDTGVLPLVDILNFIKAEQDGLDWQIVASESVRNGYESYMALTLGLAEDLLGAQVRAWGSSILPDADGMKRMAWQQIWADHRARNAVPEGLVRILAKGSLASRTRALLGRLSPGNGCDLKLDRGLLQGLQIKLRSLWIDVTVKFPKYARSLCFGNLTPFRVRAAIRRFRDREKVAELLKITALNERK